LLVLLLGTLSAGCRYRPARFDVVAASRQSDLAAAEVPGSLRVVEGVTLREVRFSSLSWENGTPRPIRIQAFLATPPGSYPAHSKPGVVFAHGLGGQAEAQTAIEMCRNLDVVALALAAPGVGASEGTAATPTNPRPLFADGQDVRRSWLYAYVYAILRSLTYLQTRPEVDPQALALSGFSMGGIATFIANGVDARIRGALPVAATGGLAEAAASETWLRALVLSTGELKPEDERTQDLFRALDPLAYADRQHGAVYMLSGAQDEYFPLAQAVRTYLALRAPAKSLALFADFDHGWYFGSGCPARCMPGASSASDCPPAPTCPAVCPSGARPPYCGPQMSYNRQADFGARWSLLLRALVAQHVARPPRPFQAPPTAPTVEQRADQVLVRAPAGVHAVRLAVSEDCGWTYAQFQLTRDADGTYRHRQSVAENAIVFAEVEREDGAVATSVPRWPPGCPVRVRPYGPRP
jgi:dienelactone hydrolase